MRWLSEKDLKNLVVSGKELKNLVGVGVGGLGPGGDPTEEQPPTYVCLPESSGAEDGD
jgi:hypothetical protein